VSPSSGKTCAASGNRLIFVF